MECLPDRASPQRSIWRSLLCELLGPGDGYVLIAVKWDDNTKRYRPDLLFTTAHDGAPIDELEVRRILEEALEAIR